MEFQITAYLHLISKHLYSKLQEYEADKLASEALAECFDIVIDHQVQIFQFMQVETKDADGFWDQHPSWADRIENIKKKAP
ncbi:MAG: M48 family metalloprotease [Smithella sp.]